MGLFGLGRRTEREDKWAISSDVVKGILLVTLGLLLQKNDQSKVVAQCLGFDFTPFWVALESDDCMDFMTTAAFLPNRSGHDNIPASSFPILMTRLGPVLIPRRLFSGV